MIYELLEDLHELLDAMPKGHFRKPFLEVVSGALELSAHVLAADPLQLPSQMCGRLLGNKHQQILPFLSICQNQPLRPWLRTQEASLAGPGGKLVRTLTTIDGAAPLSAAALSSGGNLICGFADGTLRICDVFSSRQVG